MRSLSILVLLFYLLPLMGQNEPLRSLAVEICTCLNDANTELTEELGTQCLIAVAEDHEKMLRQAYNLDARNPEHRDVLSDFLIEPLLEVCPLLRTVRPKDEPQEYRWADSRKDRNTVARFRSPKNPPADTFLRSTTEPPARWRAAGTLSTQPGSKGLRLVTDEGKELNFELPAAVARKRDFDPGQKISLSYRREWRVNEDRVVLVVLTID
ncbi:hypothetical protein FUA23_18185 [Neolewinella aurantiaca]|uniref:Uncharacterized protein n=1 Tax=Neolewinella aurantiaca TaxID=2602767 RepID=A0A5C7FDS2_9BACT|nr:hypothetical protein [Neolewinella aurantiaca]TXF87630.1 hypothetical protein FUA23_18185 [Neolewinella aurantiaca]